MAIEPLLFKYKGNRCANCGLTVELMLKRYGVVNKVFQFNHIDPTKKHPDYDNLIQRVMSTEQLDEVDKCILLCNICHDVLHAQRGTAEIAFAMHINDRTVEQRIKGQTILNLESGTLNFFSDEPVLLIPYAVKRGDAKPELLTAFELNDGRLIEYILETKQLGKFLIWQQDRTIMIDAKRLDSRKCTMDWNVNFPLFKYQEKNEDGSGLWIRGGKKIHNPKHGPVENPVPATGMIGMQVTYAVLRRGLKQQRDKQKDESGR
jgi:hypothetical protein